MCEKINTIQTPGDNLEISKGAVPKRNSPKSIIQIEVDTPSGSKMTSNPSVQTGIDRYFTVLKRKRSPKSSRTSPPSKQIKEQGDALTGNRFAILGSETKVPEPPVKAYKPPPPPQFI